ncbi:MAG: ribosome biogenesis factor YjgA [Woeseiaceae bacterium]
MTRTKPSKTERKRRQQALQQLGEQLIELKDDALESLALEERLRDAIDDARKMKSREALRRHKQYIGKLMRDVDPEPIRALLSKLRADDRRQKRIFADAERWRDRMIGEGREALSEFEEVVGEPHEALRAFLDELAHAGSDRMERTIRRNIFRDLHDALAARTTDG